MSSKDTTPPPLMRQPATPEAAKLARVAAGTERLDTLDGMRGVAALLVVIYHFLARWAEPIHSPTLYPHGNVLQHMPFLSIFGMVGIFLFFLISGFVIMMTLERSSGIVDFTGRRVARLWPAMIVCATLSTLLVNHSGMNAFYPGDWSVNLLEYLSSIVFVPPSLTARALNLDVDPTSLRWVEGVYWTLWHEVRFYGLIAIAFLLSPRAWFLWVWAAIQAVSTTIEVAGAALGPYPAGYAIDLLFQPRILAWFSLGLCGYMLWTRRTGPAVAVIAVLAVVAILAQEVVTLRGGLAFAPGAAMELFAYGVIVLPFALFLARSPLLGFMRTRALIVVGLASYPLYLFHEQPGLIGMMLAEKAGIGPWTGLALTTVAVIVAAIAIHWLVENPAKTVITRSWRRGLSGLEARFAWLRF